MLVPDPETKDAKGELDQAQDPDIAKRLIVYPELIKSPEDKKRVYRRSSSRKTKKGQKTKNIRKTVQVGDVIGSFHITQILADKIAL